MAQQTASGSQTAPPIIIDLGKVKKKKVRQLKEGRGELALEVQQVLADARRDLADGANKELVPVILVYQQKRRKGGGGGGGLFPF